MTAPQPGSAVDLAFVGRAVHAHLAVLGRPLVLQDRSVGQTRPLPLAAVADPRGVLPVLLVAAEAVWREATGKTFALDIVPDRHALLGFRAERVGAGAFTSLMLAMLETLAQLPSSGPFCVNDFLTVVWQPIVDRRHQAYRRPLRAAVPAARGAAA